MHGRRRIIIARSIAGAGAMLSLALLAAPANASLIGPCTGTVAGRDIRGLAIEKKDAITVQRGTLVPITATTDGSQHVKVTLQYIGMDVATIADEDFTGTTWNRSASVDRYAKHGVGYYVLHAALPGCIGDVLLTTPLMRSVKARFDPHGTLNAGRGPGGI